MGRKRLQNRGVEPPFLPGNTRFQSIAVSRKYVTFNMNFEHSSVEAVPFRAWHTTSGAAPREERPSAWGQGPALRRRHLVPPQREEVGRSETSDLHPVLTVVQGVSSWADRRHA